jgi:molybdopterin molybdotransferase
MIDISFSQAYDTVINNITPIRCEAIPVEQSIGRATAEDIRSLVDSPSADVSLKDGYAVLSEDLEEASSDTPVALELIGSQFAGKEKKLKVTPGKAVKITSGAVIPDGADGVLSEEFALEEAPFLKALATVGENVLKRGTDVKKGAIIISKHTTLTPTQVGLIAAGGHATVDVYRKPLVTIIATGDEIVAPGKPIGKGKVAASNLVTLAAWCTSFHMESETLVVSDSSEEITAALRENILLSDCIITSGGAWKSERDLVVSILDDLGWQKMFHRVKLGPGKAVAFGLLNGKPVFCLPGGPPSNQMAFLQLALPGLRCLGGHKPAALPSIPAVLEEEVRGQKDWTQCVLGFLKRTETSIVFSPQQISSRLQRLSRAHGIIRIPEGIEKISAGSLVKVQVLAHLTQALYPQPNQ